MKDENYIYFLLEVCYGITINKFYQCVELIKQDFIKFIVAQVILGLENLHSRFIVYRDLKASNVVIDSKGKAKVLDFGFGRKLTNGQKFIKEIISRSDSYCGTTHIMAPEFFTDPITSYSHEVDFYSLGILIHEFSFKFHCL